MLSIFGSYFHYGKMLVLLIYFYLFIIIINIISFFQGQGSISELVCQIFGIKYDFFGSVISNVAKVSTLTPFLYEPCKVCDFQSFSSFFLS